VYKKRWYDGLNDIYAGKDEFEIKFGCFGGDGGSSSSGPTAQDPNDRQNSPSPTTGFRGEQSAASPSNQGYSGPTGVGIGPGSTGTPSGSQTAGMTSDQSQANQNISNNIATAISANQAINNPANQSISDNFTAIASAPTSSVSQNVSAVSNAPSVTGLSGYSGLSGYNSNIGVNTPTDVNTGTPTSTQDVVSDALSGLNVGGFDVTAGKVGTGYGLTGTFSFAKGGAVNQGIGSVFPYPRRR
jgi:hypothetical protein